MALQGIGLQGEVLAGPQVADPQLPGGRLLAAGPALEEQHVGLDPVGIEYAGDQPEQGLDVAVAQQVAPDRLPGAALKEHVVGYHDGRAAEGLLERSCPPPCKPGVPERTSPLNASIARSTG